MSNRTKKEQLYSLTSLQIPQIFYVGFFPHIFSFYGEQNLNTILVFGFVVFQIQIRILILTLKKNQHIDYFVCEIFRLARLSIINKRKI